jgi:NADH-quinone oxidoreductase B subunit
MSNPLLNLLLFKFEDVLAWAQSNSIHYLGTDLACCGIELRQAASSRYDLERFGAMPVFSPSQADLLIISGTVTYKNVEKIKQIYSEMLDPKYVISLGSCSNCGGMFSWEYSYSTLSGVDKIIPVDVFIPGCPPRPEAILDGVLLLQKQIEEKKVKRGNHTSFERTI